MATLVPCPNCDRHVRASESSCPFCDAKITTSPRALEPMPGDRLLARSALMFATAAATTLAACGKETAEKPPVDNSSSGMAVPAYGVPPPNVTDASAMEPQPAPTTTATPTSTTTNTAKTGTPVPAYGVPPINRTPTPTPKK